MSLIEEAKPKEQRDAEAQVRQAEEFAALLREIEPLATMIMDGIDRGQATTLEPGRLVEHLQLFAEEHGIEPPAPSEPTGPRYAPTSS